LRAIKTEAEVATAVAAADQRKFDPMFSLEMLSNLVNAAECVVAGSVHLGQTN
jgi:hypothetical protein